jgi:hypothetical protein
MSVEKSNDKIGNRSRDLPASNIVTPKVYITKGFFPLASQRVVRYLLLKDNYVIKRGGQSG